SGRACATYSPAILPPAPRLVLDDEWRAENFLHLLADDAREHVARAPRRERHHQRDRMIGVSGKRGTHRHQRRQHTSSDEQAQRIGARQSRYHNGFLRTGAGRCRPRLFLMRKTRPFAAAALCTRPVTTSSGVAPQAVFCSARPSSATICSRIMNFCTLPVTVIGKASTNLM